jgi:hypothetical protein
VRTFRFTLICALVSCVLAAAAIPAGAEGVSDPNDVAGKLDLHLLSGTKAHKKAPLRITLSTYEALHGPLIARRKPNRLFILFDVDRDRRREYRGRITGGRSGFGIDISGQGSHFETIPVHHPDPTTLTMKIPGNFAANPAGRVKIAARSKFFGAGSCSRGCRDRVPDVGWLTVAHA